jgi:hypothetical protein
MSETPIYDQLISERLGRGPTEFEGHDTWDDSEAALEAYARGVAESEATFGEFWGRGIGRMPGGEGGRPRRSA